jgi:hypothetical protein
MSDTPKEQVSTSNEAKIERPPRIINIKALLEATGNNPIFTRTLIEHAADQLKKAKERQAFELLDCYGNVHTFESEAAPGKQPALIYNNYHTMADENLWEILQMMPADFQQSVIRGFGDDLDEMVKNAKLPICIHFEDVKDIDYEYDVTDLVACIMQLMEAWDECPERDVLYKSLEAMSHATPITNIICFGNGSIARSPDSTNQHVVASSLAVYLASLYDKTDININQPIKIYAQDPAYSSMDIEALRNHDIEVLDNPKAFLAVDSGSLILSSGPTVPVKQIIADLAAEDPSKCPAAVLWNNNRRDDQLGIDPVTYKWVDCVYFANPISQRSIDMMKGWTKVFDGEEQLGSRRTDKKEEDWSLGTEWLSQMQIWARPAEFSTA